MEKNLDYFKKKVIAILKQKDDEVTPGIKKSLDDMDYVYGLNNYDSFGSLEKSYGVGTVRIWKGKKYKKVSQNPTKWVRVFDKVDRGAKGSMTRLINKADSCKSVEELLQFCMSNHALFKDQNGVDLPIMDELRAAVDEKKKRLENGDTSSIRPEKKTAKKAPETPKEPEKTKKTSEEYKTDYLNSFKNDKEFHDKIIQELSDGKNKSATLDAYYDSKWREFEARGLNVVNPVNEPEIKGFSDALAEIYKEGRIAREAKESEEEKHINRSNGMLGNQNAKKDLIAEEAAKLEKDKADFKFLVDRYNFLEKEFKSNGGYSYKRTTSEQDKRRNAAMKEQRELEQKINEFKTRMNVENKDTYRIPAVYNDTVNEWIKRKVKGQTISTDWLHKKFGGSVSETLPFGDDMLLELADTEDISNPIVRIRYKDPYSAYTQYVSIEVGKMDEENYHPRFMPQDSKLWSEVYKRFDNFRKQINNATGNTPAEKLFNTVMGVNNAYNENSDTSNIPRFRFTKDGIKDKSGKLQKINASVRDVGTPNEYIRLYADDYGNSIPSIFYPENDSDAMTDYFEKDNCDVKPDHPYYNHLKVMAFKNELYKGRSTKWAKMTPEQQKVIENQIKELEKQLVEPTEEELKDYRVNRDKQEKAKETWKEAERKVNEKERKEYQEKKDLENGNKLKELLTKFAESIQKEPPIDLTGLDKQGKINALNDRILKLGFEINNSNDDNEIESKEAYREQLKQRLEEVKNEPDNTSETYWVQDSQGNRLTNDEAKERIKENFDVVTESFNTLENKLNTKDFEVATKANINSLLNYSKTLIDRLNPDERKEFESDYEKFLNRSEGMKGNKNAAGFHIVDPKLYEGNSKTETPTTISEAEKDVEEKKQNLEDVKAQKGTIGGYEYDDKKAKAEEELKQAEWDLKNKKDDVNTPRPKIDTNVASRIDSISMSGHSGEVYQHDMDAEMKEFREMFNTDGMNQQQKEYFQERLNAYGGLVGESYGDMANKRLAAGPSWVVAGPAKYNMKRYQQKMDAERKAYETFAEKKDKFIKNTEKRLKELKYSGGTESVEDVKKKVFDDYSRGKYGYGDKIDNTDPYAIEKISGKIKYMEDAHNVTLMYQKKCRKAGITNVEYLDRTDEEKAKRKEVMRDVIAEAKANGISDESIKQGLNHPFSQNQTADIRRNKERLEELQKRNAAIEAKKAESLSDNGGNSANTGRVDFDGGYIYENTELDRIQIIYDGKPSRDVIDNLKHHGFHWSPSQGAWQRQLNRNGRMAVNSVMAETGINTKIDIDGAGEVKKSIPRFFFKAGRFLVRK